MADEVAEAAAQLHRPGLVVLTGPPGSGRSTMLHRITGTVTGPVHSGGGLAMLQNVPALALSRAVRARLPAHDIHLLAEAVRSRVRGGLLVLDDLQYADPATLAALPHIAAHCRVLAALRTPHRLPVADLPATWVAVPPMPAAEALELARGTAPQLDPETLSAVAARAGGNPLAIIALARQAAAGRAPTGIDQVAYAIATALADLSRPARTALAALGLLGRPAPGALLGAGAGDLLTAGLVAADADGQLVPVSTYLAETAAGLLDAAARVDLHTRLAELTPPAEAARHLAAAGDAAGAHRLALQAADRAEGGERAALLLFACELDVPVDVRVRIAAADAALAAGRPDAAARVLAVSRIDEAPGGTVSGRDADVLRGEALLQAGDPAGARRAVRSVPDAAPASVAAARDRVLLLAELATDPLAATDLADKISMRWPQPPPGVAAALAAVAAHHRSPGWDKALAAAAAGGGDPLITRWSAWLLVDHLIADARLVEAASVALAAAKECGAALAYGWQTRFTAAADWSLALHGTGLPTPATDEPARAAVAMPDSSPLDVVPAGDAPDAGEPRWDGVEGVLRRAANLADRALPDEARGYATAATALIEADTGLLGAARARLDAGPQHPATAWVARETAWLDGQPDRALREPADTVRGPAAEAGGKLPAGTGGGLPVGAGGLPADAVGGLSDGTRGGLLAGLHAITARWAAYDLGTEGAPPIPSGLPAAARRTLTAWATGTGFAAAAHTWQPVALRERIRCLLAAGLIDTDPQRAVAALLSAEQLADTAGLTVLAGRARRGLRRHRVHRDVRSPRSGDQLTRRETDVLRLVAAGEPTRRIAGQLGISAETVDTHIRAGMRKLGARTRTEAAALAFANPADDTPKDGR
ncbi:LuxR C-terminal-related transcriptional regulator [Actinoplanes sp. TBRC 11911]|uniref:LuxR C-terminal-related transcriptional regulator n=1 Tax=Actinoplanes sp. TBRC 11911 TaxID=2729386 RepID=UPI00289EA483|nr:LuxR C-terminal-related transcriptional regulator [Actinoplanes sp. TBRC 11911]